MVCMRHPKINVEAPYDSLCSSLGDGGPAVVDRWQDLRSLLAGRPGWRFAIRQTSIGLAVSWLFPDGGADLIVDVGPKGYRIRESATERELTYSRLPTFSRCVKRWEDIWQPRRPGLWKKVKASLEDPYTVAQPK